MPVNTTKTILPRVNLELALPKNVRKLRFNQNDVSDKFGTFKQFLTKYDDKISHVKRSRIMRIYKEYHDKYGSSSDDEEEEKKKQTIDVSISRDNIL